MTTVIGFGYKMRQGKDTAVQAIMDAYGGMCDVRRYALADALKQEVTSFLVSYGGDAAKLIADWKARGAELDIYMPDWVEADSNPDMSDPLCPYGKHRKLLQWWGAEYRRAQDPDYWVRRLISRIAKEYPAFALVSDVRFKNEHAWVTSCGYTVKCLRYGYQADSEHISERDLDDVSFDFEIHASTVQAVKDQARWIFQKILRLQDQRGPDAIDMLEMCM